MRRTLAVLLLVLVAACGAPRGGADERPSGGTPAASGPEKALRSFLVALDRGDCAEARTLVVTPDSLGCDLVGQLEGSYTDAGLDPAGATYTAGPVEGSSVEVTADFDGAEREPWELERVDGAWRVVFDSPV